MVPSCSFYPVGHAGGRNDGGGEGRRGASRNRARLGSRGERHGEEGVGRSPSESCLGWEAGETNAEFCPCGHSRLSGDPEQSCTSLQPLLRATTAPGQLAPFVTDIFLPESARRGACRSPRDNPRMLSPRSEGPPGRSSPLTGVPHRAPCTQPSGPLASLAAWRVIICRKKSFQPD